MVLVRAGRMVDLAVALVLVASLSVAMPTGSAYGQDPDPDPPEEDEEERTFPVIGGGEVRAGPIFPSVADQAWNVGVDMDLGAALFRSLRVFVGYTGLLGVDVDRDLRGEPLRGDFTAHGGRTGLRLHVLRERRFVPYVSAAAVVYNADTDADDPEDVGAMDDIYGGTRLGWSLGAGLLYPLEPTEQMVALAELRRASVGALRHWALDVGVRVELREDR